MAIAIPISVLIAVFAVIEDGANRQRSSAEVDLEGSTIARTVELATENALRDRQLADVKGLIDDLSGHTSVLGVRLFDTDGHLVYSPSNLKGAPQRSAARIRGMLRGGHTTEEHYRIGRQPVIAWMVPLASPSGVPLGAEEILQPASFVEEDAAASSRAIAAMAAALILAVALTVFMVTRGSVARPIEELVASAREVGSGDWSARVPVRRRDELGRLAREFNSMCERLERTHILLVKVTDDRRRVEASLREAERLASMGRLAAGLAHEIGTPLNVIAGRAEAIRRRDRNDDAQRRSLGIIVGQIERISRIVRGMLDFARVRDMRIVPTDLAGVIGHVVDLVEERFQARGIRIETNLPPHLAPLAADADKLQQVFLNLAVNAEDAMVSGGRLMIRVTVGARARPNRGTAALPCVAIAFEDTGSGIPPEHLDRVFDPFFTTKEVGSGTGLGLAVSYGIVQEHGGWIEVESPPGQGTRVTVCLPFEAGASDAEPLVIESAPAAPEPEGTFVPNAPGQAV